MKKFARTLSIMLTAMLIGVLSFGTVNVEANESSEDLCIDGSYLTEDDSSEGVIEALPWGTYLKSGSSTVSDAGNGKVSATGTTVGQRVVSKIHVAVRLQKYVNGSWQAYRSWSATNTNSAYVSLTKTISVDRGYYYRVKSTHTADGETSSSASGGVYID